jgi:PAS domain S-box-containing protein
MTDSEQRRADRRLITLVESAPDPILLFEANGSISYVNARAEELFGYTRDELLGQPAELLVPHALRAAHEEHRCGFLRQPSARAMGRGLKLNCLARDGREIPVEINLSPIEADDVLQIAATIRDVTERRREQQEVLDARDAAQRAYLTKSRFVAAASHDLRQPLQALSMYLAIASADVGADKRRDVLAKMRDTLAGMRSLLNTLLDLSRLDGGQVTPDIRVFPVSTVLHRIAARVQLELNLPGQKLHYVPCSAWVRSDPGLLEDMVSNLLLNAVKHAPTGRILLGCRRRQGKLRIDVIDTGPGIPAEQQAYIFEEFAQLPGPPGSDQSGLGLGLSIVQRLGELLDHAIELDSTPDRGSRFSITVPLLQGPELEPARGTPLPAEHVTGDATMGARVLVVDDERAVRDATALFLQLEGFSVAAAAAGDEALRLAARVAPDIAIVDYHLSGETGLDFVARLRRTLERPALPAILVTGESQAELSTEAAAHHCRLLLKPVDTLELTATLRRLLAR